MRFFDLLFQRYSDPMTLLDNMIRTQRLPEFVAKVIEIYNEEKKESMLWDIWLNRVHDRSYSDFVASVDTEKQEKLTDDEVAGIVDESISILENFKTTE